MARHEGREADAVVQAGWEGNAKERKSMRMDVVVT